MGAKNGSRDGFMPRLYRRAREEPSKARDAREVEHAPDIEPV
jgi:hypothetical protein